MKYSRITPKIMSYECGLIAWFLRYLTFPLPPLENPNMNVEEGKRLMARYLKVSYEAIVEYYFLEFVLY